MGWNMEFMEKNFIKIVWRKNWKKCFNQAELDSLSKQNNSLSKPMPFSETNKEKCV